MRPIPVLYLTFWWLLCLAPPCFSQPPDSPNQTSQTTHSESEALDTEKLNHHQEFILARLSSHYEDFGEKTELLKGIVKSLPPYNPEDLESLTINLDKICDSLLDNPHFTLILYIDSQYGKVTENEAIVSFYDLFTRPLVTNNRLYIIEGSLPPEPKDQTLTSEHMAENTTDSASDSERPRLWTNNANYTLSAEEDAYQIKESGKGVTCQAQSIDEAIREIMKLIISEVETLPSESNNRKKIWVAGLGDTLIDALHRTLHSDLFNKSNTQVQVKYFAGFYPFDQVTQNVPCHHSLKSNVFAQIWNLTGAEGKDMFLQLLHKMRVVMDVLGSCEHWGKGGSKVAPNELNITSKCSKCRRMQILQELYFQLNQQEVEGNFL